MIILVSWHTIITSPCMVSSFLPPFLSFLPSFLSVSFSFILNISMKDFWSPLVNQALEHQHSVMSASFLLPFFLLLQVWKIQEQRDKHHEIKLRNDHKRGHFRGKGWGGDGQSKTQTCSRVKADAQGGQRSPGQQREGSVFSTLGLPLSRSFLEGNDSWQATSLWGLGSGHF